MTETTALGKALLDRTTELGMTWQRLVQKSGVSLSGLGYIRRGERNPSRITKRQIEDAVDWEPGSIDRILEGGKPTPIKVTPSRVAEFERLLREAADAEGIAPEDLLDQMRAQLAADRRESADDSTQTVFTERNHRA